MKQSKCLTVGVVYMDQSTDLLLGISFSYLMMYKDINDVALISARHTVKEKAD